MKDVNVTSLDDERRRRANRRGQGERIRVRYDVDGSTSFVVHGPNGETRTAFVASIDKSEAMARDILANIAAARARDAFLKSTLLKCDEPAAASEA